MRARICHFGRVDENSSKTTSPSIRVDDWFLQGIASVSAWGGRNLDRRNGGICSCGTVADAPDMYSHRYLAPPRPSQGLHACSEDESAVEIRGQIEGVIVRLLNCFADINIVCVYGPCMDQFLEYTVGRHQHDVPALRTDQSIAGAEKPVLLFLKGSRGATFGPFHVHCMQWDQPNKASQPNRVCPPDFLYKLK